MDQFLLLQLEEEEKQRQVDFFKKMSKVKKIGLIKPIINLHDWFEARTKCQTEPLVSSPS